MSGLEVFVWAAGLFIAWRLLCSLRTPCGGECVALGDKCNCRAQK